MNLVVLEGKQPLQRKCVRESLNKRIRLLHMPNRVAKYIMKPQVAYCEMKVIYIGCLIENVCIIDTIRYSRMGEIR